MSTGWLMFKYSLLPTLAIPMMMRRKITRKILPNLRRFY